jgi:DNA polymerase elongation subunit (family B)
MSNKSKWSKYSSDIEKLMKSKESNGMNFTRIAAEVLGDDYEYGATDLDHFRRWISKNFQHLKKTHNGDTPRLLIYDLETSRAEFKRFWTGKQFLSHKDMKKEPSIISVAWKWFGEDNVKTLVWDSKHSDKKLLKEFLKEYNKADLIIGVNNNSFDNRWINARAAKYGLDVNVYVKSFDLMRQAKSAFRLPSYSMDFMTKYFGLSNKLNHEGILMWDMVEDGTAKEQKEYLQKMVDYNIGDIVATEDLFVHLRKYFKLPVHLGAMTGEARWTSPYTGSDNVKLLTTISTGAGTIQRVMKCQDTGAQFKISNSEYFKFMKSV